MLALALLLLLLEEEEGGVTVAPAELLIDDSPPPPKTRPRSTASRGGDTLGLKVGEPGGVVDVVWAKGVRGEWKWMCGWRVDLVD